MFGQQDIETARFFIENTEPNPELSDEQNDAFKKKEEVDDFSKVVSFEDIKQKKYSLSAGQYFDIKIEYVDITENEFNSRMAQHQENLQKMFEDSHALENDIMEQLKKLKFNA